MRPAAERVYDGVEVIRSERTGRQSTLTVRSARALPYPAHQAQRLDLSDST